MIPTLLQVKPEISALLVRFHPGERDYVIPTQLRAERLANRPVGFHPGERDYVIPTVHQKKRGKNDYNSFHPGERDYLISTVTPKLTPMHP